MKEFKVENAIVYNDYYDIHIHEYLKFEEIKTIVDDLLSIDNVCNRMIVKDWYVLNFATDIELGQEVDVDKYNYFVSIGLIEAVYDTIMNVGVLDSLVAKGESSAMVLSRLASNIEKQTDKLVKKLPSKKKMESILEGVDGGKEIK